MAVYASCKFPMLEEWKAKADKNKALGVVDSVLTGYAQIPLNDNSFAGLLLLAGIFLGSVQAGVSSLFCAAVAACLARLLGIPEITQRLGLATLGSSLIGIGMAVLVFPGKGITIDLLMVDAACAVLVVLLTAAISGFLGQWESPAFALPFCTAMLIVIPASLALTKVGIVPVTIPYLNTYADPALVEPAVWTASEFVSAVLNGLSEMIFMADARSAVIIIIAMLMASRIDALMAVYAAALSTLLAIALGLPKPAIMMGLYGFNAVFTMLALFGRSYAMSVRSFIFASLAACSTVFLYAGMSAIFAPFGAPVGAMPFSIVCVLAIAAKGWFTKLWFVPPAFWGVPETIAKHLKEEDKH